MKTLKLLLVVVLFSAFITACTFDDKEIDPSEEAYKNADPNNGGILYDKFWAVESDYNQSSPNIATFNSKPDFFRCKQCHAWDGLGSSGSYINRGPKTNRPNVASLNLFQLAQSKTAQELFDALTKTEGRRSISYDLSTYNPATNAIEGDKMPNLNEVMTEKQIWDLVKFLKEGMMDVTQLYDGTYTGTYPTGTHSYSNVGKNGNPSNGNNYYKKECASCHGNDGTTLNGVPHTIEGYTIGQFTRKKPFEVQHKVHYGQLGSNMSGEFNITESQMKDLYKALSDVTKYPDAVAAK